MSGGGRCGRGCGLTSVSVVLSSTDGKWREIGFVCVCAVDSYDEMDDGEGRSWLPSIALVADTHLSSSRSGADVLSS